MMVERRAQTVMRGAGCAVFVLCALCAQRATLSAQGVDDATQLLRTGKYAEAAVAFSSVPQSDDD